MPDESSISLIKPSATGPERIFTVKNPVIKPEPLGGGEGPKHRLTVENRPHGTKPLQFITKEYPQGPDVLLYLKDLANIYQELSIKGYPVPRTARVYEESDQTYLALSDLTEGGKKWIWGHNDSPNPKERETLRAMELSDDDMDDIQDQLNILATKAAIDNYDLAFYYFHVRKDKTTGTIDVSLLDLNPEIRGDKNFNYEQQNLDSVRVFMNSLRNIVHKLHY